MRGFCETGALLEMGGPVMRELVMEAMRCSGDADTFMSSPVLLTAMEVMGVTRLPRGVAVLRPGGGRGGA